MKKYCPRCGAKIVKMERSPNGKSYCENGHSFPHGATLTYNPFVGTVPMASLAHTAQQTLINGCSEYVLPGISVQFQRGPVKEHGENGCQNADVYKLMLHRLEHLNKLAHCIENDEQIALLNQCISIDAQRTARREKAGTEGTSEGN